EFQRFLEELKKRLEEAGTELSPLARALLEADSGRLEKLLREAAEQAGLGDIQHGFQEGRFAHAVAQALGLSGLSMELARLKELLARRLRNVVSIRRKRARRGKFDSSDTMRRNLQYGGVPFRIVFDRKRKEKPQVMVLCDVSDSVRNVSRFMLQFVYSLQDLYSKVR